MKPEPRLFSNIVGLIFDLIQAAIPVVAGLALLVFFWGLTKFIANVSGDAKAVAEGKKLMIWGVIALFIMVSVWGLIRFFYGELGFTQFGIPLLPQ